MSPFVFLHERWFVDMNNLPPKDPFFMSWNDTNLAYALAAIGIFILAIVIHFLIRDIKFIGRLKKIFHAFAPLAPVFLRTFTGIFIFLVSILPHELNQHIPASFHTPLTLVGMAISLAFLAGIFLRTASLAGILLYLIGFFFLPPLAHLHYLFLFGTFLYFLISGDPFSPKIKMGIRFSDWAIVKISQKYQPYGMAILRMSVSVSLIVAALWNKILDPRPALAFVAGKGEFLQPFIDIMGMTIPQFVLAAGLIELLVGTLLFFGFLTRGIGLFLLVMFLLGIYGLGITEFIGHLPLMAVMYALLTLGPGQKLSFEKKPGLLS